jgi:hypothetical protein
MNKKYWSVLAILLVLFSLSVAVISCGNDEARGVPVYKGTFIAGSDDWFAGVIGAENVILPSVYKTSIAFGTLTGTIFTVSAGEVVEIIDVYYEVTVDFDCTGSDCTLDVGDGTDADGFLNCADADIQAAFTDYTGAEAGWGGLDGAAPSGAYIVGGPHIIAGAETIDYAIAGTDPAAGTADVYVVYRKLQ